MKNIVFNTCLFFLFVNKLYYKKLELCMLKLTKTVKYALIALTHISQQEEKKFSSSRKIAETYLIPTELLAKILQRLASFKIIESTKGPKGGYRLSTDISAINILNLIEIIEGPIGLTDCKISSKCERIESCTVKSPLNKINDKIINTLKNMTLDQIQ